MAGASQRQTSKRTSAETGQRKTAQKSTTKKSTANQRAPQKGSAKSRTGSRSSNSRSREAEPFQLESFVGKEILILAFFAVCLLLFLSNLGLCGAAGTFMRQVQCGIFGVLGYVFPLCLFVGVLFYVSNQYNGKAIAKLAATAALFVVLCGLIGLMTTKEFDKAVTIGEYYKLSAEKPGGGVIGGVFQKLLCPMIGKLGAYIVAILLMVMGAVFITERSVLQPISRGGRKMYDTAREDVRRRREIHEAKAEERRKYRLEQKVSGVALDTTVGEIFTGRTEEEPECVSWVEEEQKEDSVPAQEPAVTAKAAQESKKTEPSKAQNKSLGDTVKSLLSMSGREASIKKEQPVSEPESQIPENRQERPPIRITGIGFDKSGTTREDPVDLPLPAYSADVLLPKKDTRTLAELEALDSLHSNVFAGSRRHVIWDEPEESRLAGEPEFAGEPEYGGLDWNKTGPYAEDVEQTGGYSSGLRQAEAEYGKAEEQTQGIEYAGGLERAKAAEYADDLEQDSAVSYGETAEPSGEAECADGFKQTEAAESTGAVSLSESEESILASEYTETPADAVWEQNWPDEPVYVEDEYPEEAPPDASVWESRSAGAPVFAGQPEPALRQQYAEEPTEEDTPADVKRVVTATGKIVEVDIDPDEDPLTRKRIERRLAEREAAKSGPLEGGPAERGRLPESDWSNREYEEGVYEQRTRERSSGLAEGSRSFDRASGASPAARASSPAPASSAPAAVSPAPEPKRPPKPYVRPPYELMKAGDNQQKNSDRELRETARKLEMTLQNFGVGVTVTNISCGPSVTRYELQPEQGVRVSKIVGLSDDIKLNLAAADIRIEAPIPGKASVGIEVPNKENSIVFLRDLLESKTFTEHPSKLAFAVGRDISGDVVVTDLAKMPHLLIAGATGSGKSVCINTLIMSVLYKAKPEEVRLIMVDPKVVELSIYNGIPHLMIPVVTDPKKAAGALNWAVAEMTDRYKKFADWNVRDLKGYNQKLAEQAEKNGEKAQPLPQIVIIVDELADLMMVCPGDVEDAICRLAQMARAAGLHLVIATQRPSVNVITGLIKANVPSRIAFSVSSGVDSRTIIDMNGAEKLLGKGDMLFYPSGYQKPVRVQGAFVSDSEVSAVVDFLKENNESQTFDSAIEARLSAAGAPDNGASGGGQGAGQDEYFVEAGRFIIEKQKASIGMLQRAFKIGFNRAARIMDQLAEAGVVSEDAGTKAREILMDMSQYEELLQEMGLA